MSLPVSADPLPDARTVLADLLAGATTERRRQSFQAIFDVLEEMKQEGVRDYGISTVGRRLEARGIMKTQSLRNSGGADYRHLISAYAAEAAMPSRAIAAPNQRQRSPLDNALDAIPDINVRAQLRWILDDHKVLRRRVDELKAAFKSVTIGVPQNASLSVPEADVLPTSPIERLDAIALAALGRFLSDDWMKERGWQTDDNGAIYDSDGLMVAPPGFDGALRSLLS